MEKESEKEWVIKAISLLESSLKPLPQEINELDWKEDISVNEKKLINHISAFANQPGGGYFVFGIENKSGVIKGVDKSNTKYMVEKLANLSRDCLNPSVQIDNALVEYDNSILLLVYIRECSGKPVHIKEKTIEDCYIRSGGTTRKATRHEVGGLMLNSKTLRFEELHASKLISAEEVLNLLDYGAVLKLLEKPIPKTIENTLKWLEDEKMVKKYNGGYYITNLGVIACSYDLNNFDDLARKNIRLIKYKGKNKVDTENEYPGKKGYAVGFEGLIEFIKAMLPHSEIIKTALRKSTSVYPNIAIRELIANALIHQDFSIKGKGPMIEIYDDRIEISNPGRLLPGKRIDRLIGTPPESRNELLASTFRRYGICEERGTGFEKVIFQIELYGLPPVKFQEDENSFKTILFGPKKFSEMSQDERIEACYQHSVLKFLSNSSMTNTSLRERFKLNEKYRSKISRLIKDALEKNRIKLKDPDSKAVKFNEYYPYWA